MGKSRSYIPWVHKDSKGDLVFIGDYDKAKGILRFIAKTQGLEKFIQDNGNGNLSVKLQDGTVLSLTKGARDKVTITVLRPTGAKITIQVSEFYVSKHGEMPSPRPGQQSHHGVMSAWMKANYQDYDPEKAPAVLMPATNHRATFGVFNKWKADMTKKMGGKFDWSKVSEADIRALSEKMFDAAKVPAAIRRQYWVEFEKMIAALKKK